MKFQKWVLVPPEVGYSTDLFDFRYIGIQDIESLWEPGQWIEKGAPVQRLHMHYTPNWFSSPVDEPVDLRAPISGLYYLPDLYHGSWGILMPEGTTIPADATDLAYGELIRWLDDHRNVYRKNGRPGSSDKMSDAEIDERLNLMRRFDGWTCRIMPEDYGDFFVQYQPEVVEQISDAVTEVRYLKNPGFSADKSPHIHEAHKKCADAIRWLDNTTSRSLSANDFTDREKRLVYEQALEIINAFQTIDGGAHKGLKLFKVRGSLEDWETDYTAEQRQCFAIWERHFYYDDNLKALKRILDNPPYVEEAYETASEARRAGRDVESHKVSVDHYKNEIENCRRELVRALDWFDYLPPLQQRRSVSTGVFLIPNFNDWLTSQRDTAEFRDAYLGTFGRLCRAVETDEMLREAWDAMNKVMGATYPAKHPHAREHPFPEFEKQQDSGRDQKSKEDSSHHRGSNEQQKRENSDNGRQEQRRERSQQQRSGSGNQPEGQVEEYLKVFQLKPGAGKRAVQYRFRQFSSRMHPDKGGSDYIQKLFLEARDYLLPRLHDEGPDWKPPPEWKRGGNSAEQEEKREPSRSCKQDGHGAPAYSDEALKIMDRWGLSRGFSTTALERKATHLVYEVPEEAVSFVCSDFETLLPFSVAD